MKHTLFIALGLCIAAAGCQAESQQTTKVLLAKNVNSTNVAKVKDGRIKTAKASWWGFDKEDSTKALQAAINSKVPTLIVDNVGSSWLVSESLHLVSNQKIIFEDGVVVEAKKGSFKGRSEMLITRRSVHDVTLEGQGYAVLRMQKADYDNPKLYSHSEHRHGLAFRDSSNITIRNLTVAKTGGDGLYLGAKSDGVNRNILVEDVDFDDNYRQGVSVISAQDLTIRRCKMNNTSGTNPKSGIDFEPNWPGQQLTNCIIEDSQFYGNAGKGITFYLVKLTSKSKPISVAINRCKVGGNEIGLNITPGVKSTNVVKGNITLNECSFDHQYLRFENLIQGSLNVAINNSTIDYRKTAEFSEISQGINPFSFTIISDIKDIPTVGGVTFNNVLLVKDTDIEPIGAKFNGSANFAADAVNGSLYIKENGKKTRFDVEDTVQKIRAELKKYTSLRPAIVDLNNVHPPAKGGIRSGNSEVYTRAGFTFLQYAHKGQEITLDVTVRKVYDIPVTAELIAPDGKTIKTIDLPLDKTTHITFTADHTGVYKLFHKGRTTRIDVTSSAPGNGYLLDGMQFLPKEGRLYFEVPRGVKNFDIRIFSESPIDVAVLDPHGKAVQEKKENHGPHLFSVTNSDPLKSQIWSLGFSHAVWSVTVEMYAPLLPIVSTNPHTLLLGSLGG